jgi:hypothetical protein
MIHLYLYDYGEYSGVKSLTEDKLVAVHPLSDHMKKLFKPARYHAFVDEIGITGMVSREQSDAIKRHSYRIGYYDYPFYRRSLKHNIMINDLDEIWVYTDRCKEQLKGVCDKKIRVVGNVGHSRLTKGKSPMPTKEGYNLWIGQHGFLYETTFKSFIESLGGAPEDLLVLPHPTKDGSFEESFGAKTVKDVELGRLIRNAKAVYTWESTAIMAAHIHGIPTVCYEVDKDDHDNVFLKNGVAYEATEPTIKMLYNSGLEPLDVKCGVPENPEKTIKEVLYCL